MTNSLIGRRLASSRGFWATPKLTILDCGVSHVSDTLHLTLTNLSTRCSFVSGVRVFRMLYEFILACVQYNLLLAFVHVQRTQVVSGFWFAVHAHVAPHDVQGMWQAIHSAQRRSSFWVTRSHADCRHSPLLRCKAGGEDTRFATCMASQMETLTRYWECAFTSPPLILPKLEGQPQVCSSD